MNDTHVKVIRFDDEDKDKVLMHFGTKDMRWHVRRYQYEDGSLTPLGRIHYGVGEARKKVSTAVKKASPSEIKRRNKVLANSSKKTDTQITKSKNDEELKNFLNSKVEYAEFTKLKSPEEVAKSGKGSCHDQVMLELSELKNLGYDPKAKFMIEYDPKTNQGGSTHSFVYYEKNGKFYWLENAWGSQKGIHEYSSEKDLMNDVVKKFKSEATYSDVFVNDFGKHEPGESLQDLVNKCTG